LIRSHVIVVKCDKWWKTMDDK